MCLPYSRRHEHWPMKTQRNGLCALTGWSFCHTRMSCGAISSVHRQAHGAVELSILWVLFLWLGLKASGITWFHLPMSSSVYYGWWRTRVHFLISASASRWAVYQVDQQSLLQRADCFEFDSADKKLKNKFKMSTALTQWLPWKMVITFTYAYRPYWMANTIEMALSRRTFAQPLATSKTAQFLLILPTNMLVRTGYVQFTYFMRMV